MKTCWRASWFRRSRRAIERRLEYFRVSLASLPGSCRFRSIREALTYTFHVLPLLLRIFDHPLEIFEHVIDFHPRHAAVIDGAFAQHAGSALHVPARDSGHGREGIGHVPFR